MGLNAASKRKIHVGGGHEDIDGIITNHSNCIISLFFLHSFGSGKCSIHIYFIYVLLYIGKG